MKKKGKSEAETFAGAAIFFIILFVLDNGFPKINKRIKTNIGESNQQSRK